MHPHEEALLRAFIAPHRRPRWMQALSSSKRRRQFLDCLNHCPDLDSRFSTLLPSSADVVAVLRDRGAPAMCYLLSDAAELDGREMGLGEAVRAVEAVEWGTIISCMPRRLAYFHDEDSSRRLLLMRESDS